MFLDFSSFFIFFNFLSQVGITKECKKTELLCACGVCMCVLLVTKSMIISFRLLLACWLPPTSLTHSLTHSFFADFVHRLSGKMNEIFSSSSTAAAAAAAAGGGCVVRAFSEFGGAQN